MFASHSNLLFWNVMKFGLWLLHLQNKSKHQTTTKKIIYTGYMKWMDGWMWPLKLYVNAYKTAKR